MVDNKSDVNMASAIQYPSPFNPITDEWEVYMERLEQWMTAQKITKDEVKKSWLLSIIGIIAYKAVRDICKPAKVDTKTYAQICEILGSQYNEPVVVFHARKLFYQATQAPDENGQQLLLRLRALAGKCNFGTHYEHCLLDKLITCQGGRVFDRLCEEDEKITLEKASQIIRRTESQNYCKTSIDESTVNYQDRKRPAIQSRLGPRPSEFANQNQVGCSGYNYQKRSSKPIRRIRCLHCGGTNHPTPECIHKAASCHYCKEKGHIATVCPKKPKTYFVGSHNANDKRSGSSETESEVRINNLKNNITVNSPYEISITVSGVQLEFQIDTGAEISAISSELYEELLQHVDLKTTDIKLTGYSGENLHVSGRITPRIEFKKTHLYANIHVIHNGGPPIVGRNLLRKLGFQYEFKNPSPTLEVNNIELNANKISQIIQEFPKLFDGQLGEYKGRKIKLELKEGAITKFCRARPVPFAFQKQYDEEFDTLLKLGVITHTNTADWGTPVVPVLKPNGKIRICGDYKTTVNPYLVEVKHPLPRIEEIFSKLKGGQLFSKLDFSRGYNQLVLDDESKKLVALSTHRGVFLMNRLPFGITPASGIFQREVELILQGIPNVVNFIDDILITGKNEKEHLQTIKEVLKRLNNAGLKLEKNKCEFFQKEITYLGHTITKFGIKKCKKNVEAILKAPTPKNITEIRAFCGLANYYGKFVHNMANTLSPLYKLLRKDVKFDWNEDCDRAFQTIKKTITSDNILCHFDPDLPVVLTCDASNKGIGAILSHRFPNGDCKPMAFASRTYNKAEENYSTIHKEALAIVFGVQKHYQILIGRHFILQTDHKPLLSIFKPSNGIPIMAAGRVQRWAVYLSGFDFTIEYVKSANNLSDTFSRMPLDNEEQNISEINEENAYLHFMKENFPIKNISHNEIRSESRKDIEISTLISAIKENNLRTLTTTKPEFKQFQNKEGELSVERDILMWGARVIIPKKFRADILNNVHQSHMGIVKTKSICRSHFWWPNLDNDIETLIKGCEQCCLSLPDPRKSDLIPWRSEEHPWKRIHLDYAGPINNVFLLIIVDAYSKWIEVFQTKHPNCEFTLNKLYELCSHYGFPETIVSDNGTQFKNIEFEQFTKEFHIKHIFTAPGYPQTNGQAESAVKIVKKSLRAAIGRTVNVSAMPINQFLFDYRSTPHTTTLETPANLFLKREIRNRFSLIKPLTPTHNIERNQRRQITHHKGSGSRKLNVGEKIWARDYSNPNKKSWTRGRIRSIIGKRSLLIQLDKSGQLIKRHVDQIRKDESSIIGKSYQPDYLSECNIHPSSRDNLNIAEFHNDHIETTGNNQAADQDDSPIAPNIICSESTTTDQNRIAEPNVLPTPIMECENAVAVTSPQDADNTPTQPIPTTEDNTSTAYRTGTRTRRPPKRLGIDD